MAHGVLVKSLTFKSMLDQAGLNSTAPAAGTLLENFHASPC